MVAAGFDKIGEIFSMRGGAITEHYQTSSLDGGVIG
jgi:hypothetical protein